MSNTIRNLFTPEEWEIIRSFDPNLCDLVQNFPQELTVEEARIREGDQ